MKLAVFEWERKGADREMKIGLIGLGIMGKPMAKNMLKAGYELWVNDLVRESVEDVVRAGGKSASPEEIGKSCDVVMTMLPNSPHVKEVVLGEKGLIHFMHAGQGLIDMSSINPDVSREIGTALARIGVEMLDAPVSGGEPKAVDGSLSFMVGGKEEIFEMYKPLLETMGASVVHCGEIGAGNVTKLANQIIVALNIAAVSEAFTLSVKAGVKPEKIFEAIRGGLAGSVVMDAKVPMILDGNFKPGFRVDLHIKDLCNALDAAHAVGSPLPLTASVLEMLETLHADGRGGDDHSSLANYYAKLSGTDIRR